MRMTTNNLFSNIMVDGTMKVVPEVGMGATVCFYTDRHAATVIAVWEERGKRYVTVQQDTARRTDNYGMSDMQEYDYSADPNGSKYTYRYNEKTVMWDRVSKSPETGRWKKQGHPALSLGHRSEYYDFSF